MELGKTYTAGINLRYITPYIVLCLILMTGRTAIGAPPSGGFSSSSEVADEVSTEDSEEASNEDLLTDRLHHTISRGVLKAAGSIDAFFYAPQTEIEENRTTFKLNLDLFTEAEEGAKLGTGTRLKLVLPGFQDRLHLVLAGDPEDEDEVLGEAIDVAPEETDEETDGVSAALRYFAFDDLKNNLSFSAGVRVRDNQLVGFPEARYRRSFDLETLPVAFRFQQKVVWYTDEGWQESTGVDMDILLFRRYLWRSSLEGVWAEEKPDECRWGYTYDLRFTLFQPLWQGAGLRYEWINGFDACTVDQLDKILLRLRYRQNIWRPWLFFEVVPQLAFKEQEDYEETPGILFRLEAIFGHYSKPTPKKNR